MQAVVRIGGKQYLVSENEVLQVAKIIDQSSKTINLEVLAVFDEQNIKIGSPILEDAKVSAQIISDKKSPKIYVYKFKAKSNYRRKKGHRDELSIIKITSISS